MKLRKGFIVGMVSLLGVTGLAGCKKKGEDVTLKKVSINGVQRTYDEGATIDWSALTVIATYSDATSQTFTKFEFDVSAVVSSETQAVVYTSGLHEQTTLTEGVYAISVAFPSDLSTKYPAGNIAVGNATPDGYALVEYSDPSLKTGYAANIRNAGTEIEPERNDKTIAKANENKFISSNTQYVVGTLNPFIFEPEVAFENLNDPTADLISGDDIHFRKTHVVKVKSGNEYVDAPTTDYTVIDGHVKFNDSAIGKTFSLTVSLTDFAVVDQTTKKAESTFEGFTVKKGLNIYNAKQLGILNISKLTTAQLKEAKYNEHQGDTDKMFWNGNDYYQPVLNELWAQYLTKSTDTTPSVFTQSELQAYADTPAIFLQRKLEIYPTDIPDDYFIKPGELSGDTIVGCLRDSVPIYAPIVGSTDVEINGNFWTLDTTKIPLCKNDRSNNGPKAYSKDTPDQIIMPGHSTLFKFCGIDSDDTTFFNNQELRSTGKGIVRNINTIGNTGLDLVSQDFDKMLSLTGLIFVKNDYCGAVYENNIIKQYQIGVFTDNMIGQKYGGKEQTDYSFIRDIRIYDCANSGIFNYRAGGVSVSKSVFNRFGASPLMNAGCVHENRAPNTKFTPDVIFNNEITGEEIYFSALGATEAVGKIQGFGGLFTDIGNQFVYENERGEDVMNLVAIGLNGDDYLDADSPNYYSNINLNYGAANQLDASVKSDQSAQWGLFSNTYDIVYEVKFEENYAAIQKQYEDAFEENWTKIQKEYTDAFAANWATIQGKHAAAELSTKTDVARGYIAQVAQKDPSEVTAEEIEAALADETFNAYFEANYRETFEAGFAAQFEAEAGFPYPHSEAEFTPYFRAGFEPEFQAEAGFPFPYTKDDFTPYFRAGFEPQFQKAAGFPFPYTKEAFKPFFDMQFPSLYQQPPVFQTENASELFWTDTLNLFDAEGNKVTATLEGNYVHLLAPVGNTCLSLVFRIGKLPQPVVA